MPCTVMSMLSDGMLSSACEADICGALSMHVLTLASQTPSALLDWNNNYGDDPDKVVCFHCSNLPKHFFQDARMHYGEIFAQHRWPGNSYGTVAGRIKVGPMTFARVSTDDTSGKIRGYVGGGSFTADPLATFGGVGVAHIPRLQPLHALHLRERTGASRRGEPWVGGRRRARSSAAIRGLGRPVARFERRASNRRLGFERRCLAKTLTRVRGLRILDAGDTPARPVWTRPSLPPVAELG